MPPNKRRSGGAAAPNGELVRGQKAFYRSAQGVAKVTVVGAIRRDALAEPCYMIRLRDGKEKEAERKHLTPVMQEERPVDNGRRKEREGKEDVAADHMTASLSSEAEDIVRKSLENDGDDRERESPQAASSAERGTDDHCASVQTPDNDDGGHRHGTFHVDQDVYYRPPDATGSRVFKVRVLSCGTDPSCPRYTVVFSDGTQLDSVGPSRLATLTDLTSKELSALRKAQRRGRPQECQRRESSKSGVCMAAAEERGLSASMAMSEHSLSHTGLTVYSLDKGDADADNNTQKKTPLPSALSDDLSHTGLTVYSLRNEDSNQDEASTLLADGEKPGAFPASIPMVEAKTEAGGTKLVPLYSAGMRVRYKNAAGTSPAIILDAHLDDLMEPYYTVRLEDGREKQTDNAHIALMEEEKEGGEGTDGATAVGSNGGEVRKEEAVGQSQIPPEKKEEEASSARKHMTSEQTNSKKQHDNTSSLALGDDVVYTSSAGTNLRATIMRAHRDKKNRFYYVVRLREGQEGEGKEKQVYGHRLRLYAEVEECDSPPKHGNGRTELKGDKSSQSKQEDGGSRRRGRSTSQRDSLQCNKSSDNLDGAASDSRRSLRRQQSLASTLGSATTPFQQSNSTNSRKVDRSLRRQTVSNAAGNATDRLRRSDSDLSKSRRQSRTRGRPADTTPLRHGRSRSCRRSFSSSRLDISANAVVSARRPTLSPSQGSKSAEHGRSRAASGAGKKPAAGESSSGRHGRGRSSSRASRRSEPSSRRSERSSSRASGRSERSGSRASGRSERSSSRTPSVDGATDGSLRSLYSRTSSTHTKASGRPLNPGSSDMSGGGGAGGGDHLSQYSGEDDGSRVRSITKLRNFRKSFHNMKKK